MSREDLPFGYDFSEGYTSLERSTAEDDHPRQEKSKIVFIGGAPLGNRIMWWNLVSSRTELLEAAKQAWRDRTFPQVPEETEFIPLPG